MSEPNNSVRQLREAFRKHNRDDEDIHCAYCGFDGLSQIADPDYHNHYPFEHCLLEIWECDKCGKLTAVLWRIAEIRKLTLEE